MRKFTPLCALALLCNFAASVPALANDTEIEWALGGLVLKANPDVSMDSEDLFISQEEVRVNYVYTNHSDQDREVVISFPLPSQPVPDENALYYTYPDWDELDFETKVDGVPVGYTIEDRAIIETRDVTELVVAEGWPLYWFRDENYRSMIEALPEAEKLRQVELGLLTIRDPDDMNYAEAAWQVQRHIVRTQTFPANSSVRVSHRYTPLAGGTVGGMLYPAVRVEYPDEMAEYRKTWCVDDSFLAGVDRRLAGSTPENQVYYGETWLGYVLSSGANWRGPIKQFRLVVDKGEPDNLVSFCMDGVKKIAPTQFEVKKENYEPDRDLDILVLQFFPVEE